MNNKKGFFSSIGNWFKRLFMGPNKELRNLQVDKIETPMVTIIKRFFSKKISVIALVTFVLMLILVFAAPYFYPVDLNYRSTTQLNKKPGFNYLSIPSELNDAKMLSIGPSYGIGITQEGKVYVWGDSKIDKYTDLKEIPKEVLEDDIEWVAAGNDYVIAIAKSGKLYGWGDNTLAQYGPPSEDPNLTNRYCNEIYWNSPTGFGKEIKNIEAGYQITIVTFTDGSAYAWGNLNTFKRIDSFRQSTPGMDAATGGVIRDLGVDFIAPTNDGALALRPDGTLMSFGQSSYKDNPTLALDVRNATDYVEGSVTNQIYIMDVNEYIDYSRRHVVALGATDKALFISLSDGTLLSTGATGDLLDYPKDMGQIVKFYCGERHVFAVNSEGKLFCWGENNLSQAVVPDSVKSLDFSDPANRLFTGFNGNVVFSKNEKVITWGLRGYLLGTDNQGRDVFIRLLNGGNRTLTIGAISVIIASFLGIFVGIISGYFGGWLDILLMRVAEVIASMPFLPFALILSAVLGSAVTEDQRMYIIMVVLGVLSWPGLAALVRGQVLAEREKDFVLAAKAIGVKESSIAFKHILPNIISIILVSMTLNFAGSLLTESSLSYLGYGVRDPVPTWGNMLTSSNRAQVIEEYWWQWVFPSIALGISVISINLIGDGMRDAVDPKSAER